MSDSKQESCIQFGYVPHAFKLELDDWKLPPVYTEHTFVGSSAVSPDQALGCMGIAAMAYGRLSSAKL